MPVTVGIFWRARAMMIIWDSMALLVGRGGSYEQAAGASDSLTSDLEPCPPEYRFPTRADTLAAAH